MKAGAIILGNGEWGIGGARLCSEEETEFCNGIVFQHLKKPRTVGEHLPVNDGAIYDSEPVCIGFLTASDVEHFISLLQIVKSVIEGVTEAQ